MVEAIEVDEVESRSIDAYGSDSMRDQSNKSDVNNVSKNVFRALHSNVSCHVELG